MQNQPVNERYWAVDFDRCLGDVDVLFDHYISVLRDHHDVDSREIVVARKKVEASKGSFDLIGYLLKSGTLTEDELQLVGKEFIKRATGDPAVLMPGAQEFLAYLKANYTRRYGIVTFGNPYWQRLKIAAVGLDWVPCMVVDSSYKARQIASWYDRRANLYILPRLLLEGLSADELTVREVILVDDKPIAFDGLHDATRGYLVSANVGCDADPIYNGRVDRVANLGVIVDIEES